MLSYNKLLLMQDQHADGCAESLAEVMWGKGHGFHWDLCPDFLAFKGLLLADPDPRLTRLQVHATGNPLS